MYRVLFICTGNTCRSPMAEALLKKKLSEQGIQDVEVYSAGVGAAPDSPASRGALEVLANRMVDAREHRAQLFTKEMGKQADLILTMTESHKKMIFAQYPELWGKTFTLKEYVFGEAAHVKDIPDPFGGSSEIYEACAQEIEQAVDKLMDRIQK